MKKKVKNNENNKNDLLYFINNLLCMISSMLYMFFVSITSVSIFPVVKQTKEMTDDVMLETIIRADMFIIRSFMMIFVISVIFFIINYFANKKQNKKILWGLVILSSLTLIVNIVRVLMIYI